MHPINADLLIYWADERETVRLRKEAGQPKPWSTDPIFQTTYFCNVRREDDKVTKWVAKHIRPHWSDHMYEFNVILSRFLNWPPTLEELGYVYVRDYERIKNKLKQLHTKGKIWGSAYVVTTHGLKMDKIDYLCDRVLPSIPSSFNFQSCESAANDLRKTEGVSSFMAGQIVADLKNTPQHPLWGALDWWIFALPGPGSRRGMDWLYGEHLTDSQWYEKLPEVREILAQFDLCSQDTQNCLCEFDKYCRIRNGTGRSKRLYTGTA